LLWGGGKSVKENSKGNWKKNKKNGAMPRENPKG